MAIDWSEFINSEQSFLEAYAGHGKTTAIADCLIQSNSDSRFLILTHTHAGIASLVKKFKSKSVPSSKYQLETIDGFAQRIVLSQQDNVNLPSQEDKSYFKIAVRICEGLLKSKRIQYVMEISYDGVFVDEYQDCSPEQHQMILSLTENIPLHCLGDHLQGIFSFGKEKIIDLERDLFFFQKFNCLEYPWRWHPDNLPLGNKIKEMRKELENYDRVTLTNSPNEGMYVYKYPDCSVYEPAYGRFLRSIVNYHSSKSILFICPSYIEIDRHGVERLRGGLDDRIDLKSKIDFNNSFIILDALDADFYYSAANRLDKYIVDITQRPKIKRIAHLFDLLTDKLFIQKTGLSKWIDRSKNRFKKRTGENLGKYSELSRLFDIFEVNPNSKTLLPILELIIELPEIKCSHLHCYYEVLRVIKCSAEETVSILEAMKQNKTRIRHIGRHIEGKCIGTTLLTKGLEFDTVIICDADKFEDKKHFYVAISRACRQLIILTRKSQLSFKK